MNDGRIINSKNVRFLDFEKSTTISETHDELLVEDKVENMIPHPPVLEGRDSKPELKQEDEDKTSASQSNETDNFESAKESLNNDDDVEILENLVPNVPEPTGRILRERTLQVRPVKYSHFTEDPTSSRKAIVSPNSGAWIKAIEGELKNIEDHEVEISLSDNSASTGNRPQALNKSV
ncbi:hypothetical protein VP01_4282g2 [Puccinia sorghi]|uniref:Uncharacterized protein n=1 Tax=Puccinia sorghi TaxID=27349 RepID=A0A0L6UQ83_9BASI|nr:hypothetical protein VP01_4282g2 [Puccinia sorghi]